MQITYQFNPDAIEINKSASFKDSGSFSGFVKSLREIGFTDDEISKLTGIKIPEVDKAQERENAIKMRQMLDRLLKGNHSQGGNTALKNLPGYVSEDQENLNKKFLQIRKSRTTPDTQSIAHQSIFERAKQLRNK